MSALEPDKPIYTHLSAGVNALELPAEQLAFFFAAAVRYYEQDKMVVFKAGEGTSINMYDGNDNLLGVLNGHTVPTTIWSIVDDHGDEYTQTTLLPDEY